ncbi:MAG TPA: hypothetical protein VNZ52_11865 [Candidatus Thermoplasmatota archaeon]|nr:hypothetical protein [Candidatus Thermoplasmatota archaeon]
MATSHVRAFFIGIALFLVIGFGLGLMGFLVGAAGDAATTVGGTQVPVEVASVAFFALTAILMSTFVALAVGIGIGAADGRNPLMRGIVAGIASFIGFYLMVLLTVVLSGAEVTNTLQQVFNTAQNQAGTVPNVWLRLFLAGLPAAGIGLLSAALTAFMWPRRDPYYPSMPADAGLYEREGYGRPYAGSTAAGAVGGAAAGYRGGEAYRNDPVYRGEPQDTWRRGGDARDQGVLHDDPGRYAGERSRYGEGVTYTPGEERATGGVYRGERLRDRDVYWEPSRGEARRPPGEERR